MRHKKPSRAYKSRAFFILLLLNLTLVACDNKDSSKSQTVAANKANKKTAQASDNTVNIITPYVRAMPPGQKITTAFLQIENTSDSAKSLIAAKSDVSEFTELHAHTMENGMMKMGQVKNIDIPAKSTIALETGGYHIMLINLKKDLQVGQKVKITLIFKDGSNIAIHPEVKRDL